jgi:hypothetical protein
MASVPVNIRTANAAVMPTASVAGGHSSITKSLLLLFFRKEDAFS